MGPLLLIRLTKAEFSPASILPSIEEEIVLPLISSPQSSLTSFVFKPPELYKLLLELKFCGDSYPKGLLPFFFIVARISPPKLAVICRIFKK